MLTIGQLAHYAGVTVRTVRHYHQVGLLAEPPRDASGYRSYGAQDVVDLVRITALAKAGAPLGRIGDMLHGGSDQFSAALAEIDAAMAERIKELRRRRRDLAQLPSAERLSVPEAVWRLLEQLRAWGLSERLVTLERDTWILLSATYPALVNEAAIDRLEAMVGDDLSRVLMMRYDEAFELEVGDPRLEVLAQDTFEAVKVMYPFHEVVDDDGEWLADPVAFDIVSQYQGDIPPAWMWINSRVGELAEEAGFPIMIPRTPDIDSLPDDG